jgi:hypothetical protein
MYGPAISRRPRIASTSTGVTGANRSASVPCSTTCTLLASMSWVASRSSYVASLGTITAAASRSRRANARRHRAS